MHPNERRVLTGRLVLQFKLLLLAKLAHDAPERVELAHAFRQVCTRFDFVGCGIVRIVTGYLL